LNSKKKVLAAIAAGLTTIPLAAAAPVTAAPPGSAAHPESTSRWASWLGSNTTATATTLAQVRTLIGAGTGTAASLTGKGVGVALIDTGVAPVAGLPASQIVNGPDLSFESQASNLRYLDTYGHGTHMAGIIVGNDTATGTKGIAPGVKLTSIKVGTSNGTVDVSQVIAAVDWVVEHKNDDSANPIKVINLSYGSGGTPQNWNDSLGYAVEKAWRSGIVVVAAAGNDGNSVGSQANPAMNEWILSVGSADTKNTTAVSDDVLTTFTNLPANGGKQVDVLAPGVSILSLRDAGSYIDVTYPAARSGDTLFRGSGTSQSAAITSAAVALILQSKPTATPDQIKEWLRQSATYVPNGYASTMGLKEINVNAALARAVSNPTVLAQNFSKSNGSGSLDSARGSSRVMFDNVPLTGERTVWGPMNVAGWAAKANTGDSWVGGKWMGFQVAGEGWTGTSFASKTWAASTWSNSKPWTGASAWTDPGWTARTWAARTWAGGTWSARTWASDDWSSSTWG
jgi:serine protease AprX